MICISLNEQETTINFSRTEETVDIWTSDTTMMTKLDRLCEIAPETYKKTKEHKSEEGRLLSKEYQITDKTLLSFRTVKRVLTDEQKEKQRERMRALREEGKL